jgi:putative endonuclease
VIGNLGAWLQGLWGERQAERALRRKGYKILGRRVKMAKGDEIDLVARDGETLVFVEVKSRASEAFGRPLSAVDRRKRRAMSRAVVHYLRKLGFPRVCFRCDVVEVIGSDDGGTCEVRHVEDAFKLDGRYQLPY